ncbi:hypothetical protein ENTCAN_06253 [Enterobacter cancerogenus ATCC 35316]|nr:hypothetical protein ENTCAN_06253 [Enterobacter cancerogenus ATCC 35316]
MMNHGDAPYRSDSRVIILQEGATAQVESIMTFSVKKLKNRPARQAGLSH